MTTRTASTTMTERKQHAAHNLRRYLIASLATVYLFAWWAFGQRSPPAAMEAAATEPRRVIWYEELPQAQRPEVTAPQGWRITSHAISIAEKPRPVPVRAAARPGRIRTRST